MNAVKHLFLLMPFFIIACAPQEDRRISLGKRPLEAIARERVRTIRIAADEKKKIAILHLINDTRQSDLDWLRQGIAEMLALNLAQSRRLNLMPSRNVADALARERLQSDEVTTGLLCRQVAGALDAQVLITGRYFFQRDSLRVELSLWNGLSGDVMLNLSGAGADLNMRSMFRMIHPLARRIRGELEERFIEPSIAEYALVEATTSSLEAYRHFMDGVALFEDFMIHRAIEEFGKAVEKDTTFASAYMRLGVCYWLTGEFSSARPLLRKAELYADKLSERERLPILAMNARIAGDFEQAVRLYNQYITVYPEDAMGHYQLGEHYFMVVSDYRKAIEYLETAVSFNPEHKLAINLLAYAYAYIGEMEHAYEAVQRYIQMAPNDPNPYDSYGEILQREGRISEAIENYKLALKKNRSFTASRFHLAMAHLDAGDAARARKILKRICDTGDSYEKRTAGSLLAFTEVACGNLKRAEELLAAQDDASVDLWAIDFLLKLAPGSERYHGRFMELIEREKEQLDDEDYSPDRVFSVVAIALGHQLGIHQVRELLYALIESKPSPILYHIALAYATVFNLYDYGVAEMTHGVEQEIVPQTFQYSSPPPWNYYWKYYFDSMVRAGERGLDMREWAEGFRRFAELSNSPDMKAQAQLALAAAHYASDDSSSARELTASTGIPDESDWTVIGPFTVRKGFHQTFWPEERGIGEWWHAASTNPQMIRRPDSRRDGYVNLKEIAAARFNHAVYAVLPVYSPSAKRARLHLGMNGRLKVWLNDESVWVLNQRVPAVLDRYSQPVRLRSGVNWLMIRLDNPIGELGFYFRLTNMFGRPDPELMFGAPAVLANAAEKDQ